MKIMKLLLIGLVFLVSVSMTYAVPEIAYTNFARTAGGGLVLNSTVDVRITIFNSGTQVYQEIHTAAPTNGYGLFTVKLGTGAPVGADTYDAIVAVNTLNVQAETDNGGGYRFVQLSPLLNTALKNEEAAGIVTLNDAYLNGDSIEVLPGAPLTLTGTGLIQSDATIAAINANGNKTLTTKGYVDAADALISANPFLVWEAAGADLPNAKILNGEANVINFDATTATLSILNNGISEPKLKMANDPSNGYIIKWNGTDMTWVDPTVITAHPVVGDGTVGSPITLYKTGVNANDVLFYNGAQWTNGQVTSAMIQDGTIANGDINNATKFVSVTGESGTPFDVTNGNLILDFQGTGATTVTLNQATHTVYIEAGIVADIPLSGTGTASDHLKINYDATLDLNGNNLSINTGNSNTWTADQLLNATAAQGNNLVAAVNMATDMTLEADVLMYDATLEVTANALGIDLDHSNIWTANQFLPATLLQGNNLVDAANMATNQRLNGDVVNYDATLEVTANELGIDLDHSNTWTANQFLPATLLQGNNLVAAVNMATDMTLEADVLMYDATLEVTANALGIDLDHSNIWTANQFLPATLLQGNNLVDAANMATNQRLNGDVVNYDATLEVNANELGLDLDHENSWTVNQTFALVDINGGSIDGTTIGANVPALGKFTTLEAVTTALVGTDLTVVGLTTTNTLDVTVDAVVGNDLAVVNDLGVGNNAEIGNNLDVLATTHSNEFKTTNDYFVVGEALNTAYVNVWDGSVAVLEMGRGAGLGTNYGIRLNDNAGGGTRAGIGHNGMAWVAGVGDLANSNGVMMTWNSNVANETRFLVANGNLATPVFKIDAEGDVFATTYTGQLIHNVTGGAGLADLTFDNTADVAFAVNVAAPVIITADNVTLDFDATLDLNAGKLSINTNNENTWTKDQLLNATAAQGNNLVAAINLANNQSLNGDVVNYDATLEVNANELGLDLDHENIWTVKQSFTESPSTNYFGTPILEVNGGAYFTGQPNDADFNTLDFVDFMFDGDAVIMGDAYAYSNLTVEVDLNVKGIISGETNFDIQDGAGIADFTFNNTGDAIVAVDYDATLDLNVDQLSINTGHENTWTVDQNFSTIYANEYKTTNSYLVVGEALNTAYANVWDNGVAVLEMGRGAGLGSNYGIRLNDNAGGGTRAGIGYNGLAWVTGVGDLTNQRGAMMSWNSNTANESRIIVANGNLASPVFSVDAEGDVRATSLRIDNYVYPTTAGAATEFMALKAPAMLGAPYELEWWNYDSTIVVDPLAKTIGLNQNAAFNFTNIVAFNPASGSAISATSSDPSAPTVTIEHTDPLGVALELVGAEGQTTALEVTTGGINVANGQFIVSSNAGVTGAEPNGPSITVNNNGDGVSENGGALQILVGHTSFSYGDFAPANNAAVNLSNEPFTVLDITSNGTNAVTLPGTDMAADVLGTIIYVINSGAGTLTLPGTLGNVNAGTSAQLVYTANGWFRLN